jgi:hypothetical protein
MAFRNFGDHADVAVDKNSARSYVAGPAAEPSVTQMVEELSSDRGDVETIEVTSANAGFTDLEWLVVSLARRDTVRSLRKPGRIAAALGSLFGVNSNLQLADPRLEALRRLAVISWRRGHSIAPAEVRAFTAAGFSLQHYETLMTWIGSAHSARNERRVRRSPLSAISPRSL